jgi:hypothetical protein
LLTRLAKHVLTIYNEATPEQTETKLLKGIRKVCPDLPNGLGLVNSLAAIRKGRFLRSGHKVLLVLDQLEQWLHGKRNEENTELVAALRQCDGEHLQAIVMVRDDFWIAVSRFMADLEAELIPGQNIALVDLFSPRHGKKVLTLFGQAYGLLPDRSSDLAEDQQTFLDQAISGLTQDGKIVPVRLALFAEMVRERSWTPATLREIGGVEGVGLTFLEETFSSPQANPKYRLHQKGAQAVLKALLPETGTDIKGQMLSEGELQKAAVDADPSHEFAELIHILDNELRLITPTEPEGSGEERRPTRTGGTAVGGTVGFVECKTGESPFTLRAGVGKHQVADQTEGLDRTAKQDDAEGGPGSRAQDAGLGPVGLVDHVGRDRGLRLTAGVKPGGIAPHRQHD